MAALSPAKAPSARRSQAARRDESERLLLEATLGVVSEEGVAAATLDEIGRRAGYSRGLATQKFGSKGGLTEAVIAYLHREREAILEAAHVADMPAMEAIAYYVEGHLLSLSRERGGRAYFMLLAAAVADATALRTAFAASHERVRLWLRAQILRGQAEGGIRPEIDADSSALMIGALLLGLSVQWLADPETDLAAAGAASIATLRQSFAPRP